MTYNKQPLRSRDRRSRTWPAIMIALGLVVIGVVALWRNDASALAWRVLAPVVAGRDALGATGDAQLRAELASTTAVLANYNELARQNNELKAMLGRSPQSTNPLLVAVLAHPPAATYDTMVIDAGSADGVAVGDSVAAGGSTLIGTVSEVGVRTSTVILYSAPGATYQALLRDASSTNAIPVSVSGQGAGSFVAKVPTGTMVFVGDDVIFPGVAGNLLARVVQVDALVGSSFITLYMRMPVNVFDLDFVEVWRTQSQ